MASCLKRPCIEFGVVRIDSATVVCIHTAIIRLLFAGGSAIVNRGGGGVRPEWMASA